MTDGKLVERYTREEVLAKITSRRLALTAIIDGLAEGEQAKYDPDEILFQRGLDLLDEAYELASTSEDTPDGYEFRALTVAHMGLMDATLDELRTIVALHREQSQ